MKKLFVLIGALLLLPSFIFAADFKENSAAANENVKNLYIAGQTVVVDANVKSDLVAGGGNVQVNGSVENDLIAVGGTVRVKGSVGRNVRVAGGNIFLDGAVNEDVTVAGGSVNLSNSSVVNGDVIVAAGTVEIDGQIKGNVYLTGGMATIRGNISGNVIAKGVGTLNVANGAVIAGKLNYSSRNEATIDSGAKVGSVDFTRLNANQDVMKNAQKAFAGTLLFKALIGLITLLVLVYLFPKTSLALTESAFSRVWINLLIGFVTVIVAPVALFLLLITIFGSGLAFIAGMVYLVLLILAAPFSTLIIGAETWKLLGKEKGFIANWKTVLLGSFIALVLSFIPVFGWIVMTIFYLITLGAILSMGWRRVQLERN